MNTYSQEAMDLVQAHYGAVYVERDELKARVAALEKAICTALDLLPVHLRDAQAALREIVSVPSVSEPRVMTIEELDALPEPSANSDESVGVDTGFDPDPVDVPRPSEAQNAGDRFIAELRKMSSEEILEMAKRSGIYDEDGNLTPEFGGEQRTGHPQTSGTGNSVPDVGSNAPAQSPALGPEHQAGRGEGQRPDTAATRAGAGELVGTFPRTPEAQGPKVLSREIVALAGVQVARDQLAKVAKLLSPSNRQDNEPQEVAGMMGCASCNGDVAGCENCDPTPISPRPTQATPTCGNRFFEHVCTLDRNHPREEHAHYHEGHCLATWPRTTNPTPNAVNEFAGIDSKSPEAHLRSVLWELLGGLGAESVESAAQRVVRERDTARLERDVARKDLQQGEPWLWKSWRDRALASEEKLRQHEACTDYPGPDAITLARARAETIQACSERLEAWSRALDAEGAVTEGNIALDAAAVVRGLGVKGFLPDRAPALGPPNPETCTHRWTNVTEHPFEQRCIDCCATRNLREGPSPRSETAEPGKDEG